MPPDYDRPHIDISARADANPYRPPSQNIGGGRAPRNFREQARELRAQLQASFREVQEGREFVAVPDEVAPADGAYYEVELWQGAKAEKLDRKRDGVCTGATKVDSDTGRVSTVVFIPDEAIPALEEIFRNYGEGDPTPAGDRPQKGYVEPIERIRLARLQSFWTDDLAALPQAAQDVIWWEVWCFPDDAGNATRTLRRMNCQIADDERWLKFPESWVIPVLARRVDIELALIIAKGITELRRGSDTPSFFLEEERENQREWANNLAERVTWPSIDAPRVCLLDTGVNRAHLLLEPALAEADLLTVDRDWPPTDNQPSSHGTEMAGLALHGDLFAPLQDGREYQLRHRLESIRVLPPDGFDPNEPTRYGSITLDAVSLAEIRNPEHDRVFCMAVTNEDRSGDRASSWSACIDRAAAGATIGEAEAPRRRLFCISGGNIRNAMQTDRLQQLQDYPVEDPAQAWNALTVGGYTDKIEIDPNDPYFVGHTAIAAAGDVSPFSRNSTGWRSGKTPIKPEIVFEAGNRAVAANGRDLIDCPSLELLTTGADVDRLPIVNFAATSAATAQAARLAARLQADHPDYWPETIRALIVHSAEWTPAMQDRLARENSLRARKGLARTFGYGVPSYVRATASARSSLALVAQQTIQPYRKGQGNNPLNECHYYSLPWPQRILEEYGDQEFRLKVTLSYFVEPNPGRSAAIDPQRYQSFGLRFHLKRRLEGLDEFKRRVNAEERDNPRQAAYPAVLDENWMLGPSSISAGSLHCDVWRGPGAQLAARHTLCVTPVSGWWKERGAPAICEQQARYALVVTLTSPNEEIDLYTPISTILQPEIGAEIETVITP